MTDRNAVAQLAYRTLRAAGLTHEAALAMLGNWDKESLLTPCRKQGDLSEAAVPSREYTAAVTSGAISREQFALTRYAATIGADEAPDEYYQEEET